MARTILDIGTVGTNLMSLNWVQSNQIQTKKIDNPHQENRIYLRSTVVFCWESLAAPVVTCSAWSLRGRILVLCAPLSNSRRTCKISYSSRMTHKATLHPPVYAVGFKALLYISSRSPKCSYNLRRNLFTLGEVR